MRQSDFHPSITALFVQLRTVTPIFIREKSGSPKFLVLLSLHTTPYDSGNSSGTLPTEV